MITVYNKKNFHRLDALKFSGIGAGICKKKKMV